MNKNPYLFFYLNAVFYAYMEARSGVHIFNMTRFLLRVAKAVTIETSKARTNKECTECTVLWTNEGIKYIMYGPPPKIQNKKQPPTDIV